jgi:3-hydroxyacyl-[acyl-carrier-protein] dehydratase
MTTQEIKAKLPFSSPYLFVDKLEYVNEKGAKGSYTFDESLDFFKGHFNGYPVVPGAILIETLAQIGGSSLGLFLIGQGGEENQNEVYFATSYNVEFYKPVYPNETVFVTSEIIYARFGKLKYNVVMTNKDSEVICKGVLSGMLKKL